MKKTIFILTMLHRRDTAVSLQAILTRYGCLIKTRLGIHDGVVDQCSDTGLIILEVVGKKNEKDSFFKKLRAIKDLKTKRVEI